MAGFISALPGAVSQGLIWGIMAIGVYITYKILDIADLTVDGSFCTGGATFVVLFGSGVNIWLALLAALLVGMLAGLVTGLLHTLCGIPAILSGILTQLALWSVNLAIMGMKANVAINLTDPNLNNLERLLVSLRFVQEVAKGNQPFTKHPIFVVGLFTIMLIAVLYWFFGTELGASLRATGANQNMARAQGINTDVGKVLGLMLSNGLVALSGALLTQYQSFADSGGFVRRYNLLCGNSGGREPEQHQHQLPQAHIRGHRGHIPVRAVLEGQVFSRSCKGILRRSQRRGRREDWRRRECLTLKISTRPSTPAL